MNIVLLRKSASPLCASLLYATANNSIHNYMWIVHATISFSHSLFYVVLSFARQLFSINCRGLVRLLVLHLDTGRIEPQNDVPIRKLPASVMFAHRQIARKNNFRLQNRQPHTRTHTLSWRERKKDRQTGKSRMQHNEKHDLHAYSVLFMRMLIHLLSK